MKKLILLLALIFACGQAAHASLPELAALKPFVGDLKFAVLRGDAPIGTHEVNITPQADGSVIVAVRIRLAVSFGPVVVYRYEHDNTEVWRGEELVSIATVTNDDGELYQVNGQQVAAGFEITSNKNGTVVLPRDLVTTSYWNIRSLAGRPLLDTQRGTLVNFSVQPKDEMLVTVGATGVPARHYAITGDLNLDIWYDENQRWVKLLFKTRGADIIYKLQP